MTANHGFRGVLLAAGVLLISACATQPGSPPIPSDSTNDKYFEREARNYQKFEHEGQTVYCTSPETRSTLIPYVGYPYCISEANLRHVVENWRRGRNAVQPPRIG